MAYPKDALVAPVAYGVWDTRFGDWDSGPHPTVEHAVRHTYLPVPGEGVDLSKHRPSKSLVVREWLKRGEPGQIIGG